MVQRRPEKAFSVFPVNAQQVKLSTLLYSPFVTLALDGANEFGFDAATYQETTQVSSHELNEVLLSDRRSTTAFLLFLWLSVFMHGYALAQGSGGRSKGGGGTDNSGTTPTNSTKGQPQSPDAGSATPIETYALAYNGLRGNALKIANRLSTSVFHTKECDTTKIFIVDRTTFDDLVGFQVAAHEIDTLHRQICNIVTPPPGGAAGGGGSPVVLSGVGCIISAIASLLQTITPESLSQNADVKIANHMLETEVTRAILKEHRTYQMFMPGAYLPLPQFSPGDLAATAIGCPYAASENLNQAYRRLILAESQAELCRFLQRKERAMPKSRL
jgi:hypothetical protein